jgi:hypothetical protein
MTYIYECVVMIECVIMTYIHESVVMTFIAMRIL